MTKTITVLVSILILNLYLTPIAGQDSVVTKAGLSPDTKKSVQNAIDRGIRFLRQTQNEQGHWYDPGITSLILTAFFRNHRQYGPEDGPWIRRPLAFVVSCQKPDGGIYMDQLRNYNTCVAIMALTAHPQVAAQYREVIDKAKQFVLKGQCDEEESYDPQTDKFYGGFGYGSSERPDLSNTHFALDALRDAGVPANHPVFQKALVFLQRCQNRSESNDGVWAGNDGGFVYGPGFSNAGDERMPDGKIGKRSYGSMTYAGIKSYIYANLKRDDPRVEAAYNWLRGNYDFTQNPGVGLQGLFYYYHTAAKTLFVLGDAQVVDASGVSHNWREDMARILLQKQNADGSWRNTEPRWWEAEPKLVTAYAILALSYCLQTN